jgi:hypothetical protein
MTDLVVRLWRGEVALARAFWEYAIIYGSFANLISTIASFAVIAANGPILLAVALHFTPLPYNVLVVVAVWRSAARHPGDTAWAMLARIAVVAWAIVATLA